MDSYEFPTFAVTYCGIFTQSKNCGARETANGSATTFVSRQRLGKHILAATDTHATIEILLEPVFSTRYIQRGYKEDLVWRRGRIPPP
jgi:hypothetical protein